MADVSLPPSPPSERTFTIRNARKHGETERRLATVAAWREAPFFTGRERAALEWSEAVTLVAQTHVPDAVWEAVKPRLTEQRETRIDA
ncbi:hypothetical protein LMG28614_00606 [Paraburkholderia ultramafica]|uniref:Carboxymuconolactone decarboxylase-like domain-containing protein n=1 Tax=Paraburkholderia ultramafica TaxID=1544867 RepID=A0A6S7AWV6_9BURK|nr:hypothetical protein LMG28614_00606 [Paraburkholderia ultramafica]